MAANKININRYRLITLLYVIFVCLSVLNVPTSLYQGNLYVIKTFEYQEKTLLNEIIEKKKIISNDTGLNSISKNLTLITFIDSSLLDYERLNSIDKLILNKLKKDNSSIEKEFNSKRKIEKYLHDDSLLNSLKNILSKHVKENKLYFANSDNILDSLLPFRDTITLYSGKKVELDQFLFLHKPFGVSYMHFKRLKVLLLEEVLSCLNKLLINKKLNIQDSVTTLNSTFNEFDNKKVTNSSIQSDTSTFKKPKSSNLNLNYTKDTAKTKAKLLESILSSLNIDKLYVGISNSILKEFSKELFPDLEISITPNANINRLNNDFSISFSKSGIYKISFFEKNGIQSKLLFEKQIKVYNLPDPIVNLNVKTKNLGFINKLALIASNRLLIEIPNSGFSSFPGRINGFRCIKYNVNNTQENIYNYGETFQSSLLSLLATLKKGDVVVFDNITITLYDGSTRIANPIIFKIAD